MRPLRLELSAFGSYPGTLVIDFVKLSQHGVFSITGPTGSGKTTLFDAMVYALYGELPGKREPEDVRSHFADASDETRVSFEFEVKGTSWTIERKPAQSRPKQRGVGVTQQPSYVVLRETRKTSGGIVKARDAKARIEEIIGLSAAQFQQVVLLPQGDFERVLKAETSDRVELLRRLFPVQIFNDFTEHLKEVVRERHQVVSEVSRMLEASVERIRRSFVAVVDALPPSVLAPWPREIFEESSFDLAEYAAMMTALSELLNGVDSLTTGARGDYEAAYNEVEGVNRLVSGYLVWVQNKKEAEGFAAQETSDNALTDELQRLHQISGLAPALDSFEEASSRLAELDRSLGRARSVLEKHWIDGYDSEGVATTRGVAALLQRATSQMEKLSSAAEECNELRGLVAELNDLGEELELARTALTRADEQEKAHAKRLEEIEIDLRTWREQVKGLPVVSADLKFAREQMLMLQAQQVIQTKLAIGERDRDQKKRALDKAHEKTVGLRLAHRDGLAGVLAATLVAGAPCPTCGSLDHPLPATAQKSVPTDDELEVAESALVSLQEKFNDIEKEIATLEGQLSIVPVASPLGDLESSVSSLEGQELVLKDLERTISTTEEDQRAIQNLIATEKIALETQRGEVVARDAQLKEKDKVSTRRRKKFESAYGPLGEFTFDQDTYESFVNRLGDFGAQMSLRDGASADAATSLAILTPQLTQWKVDSPRELRELIRTPVELDEIRESLATRRTRREVANRAIAEYESGDFPTELPDVTAVETKALKMKLEFDVLFGAQATLKVQQKSILESYRDFASSEAEVAKARDSLQEANTLYRLCSGQSAASNEIRTSLEEWVLSDYLKQVLRQANTRMQKVSSGRYSLQVNSLGGDNRGRHGLDLEVFDAYTGQARKARTLSGGETFIAALALALGLADVVAAGKNRELGALFIDEGFGSLDGDSLDSVLGILESLQDGGRIVGVISHVEEMKRALPRGITVVSSEAGSKAEIHYPDF